MDIRKAIQYLKEELRGLDKVIDAIEIAVAARCEKQNPTGPGEDLVTGIPGSTVPSGHQEPAQGVWLN